MTHVRSTTKSSVAFPGISTREITKSLSWFVDTYVRKPYGFVLSDIGNKNYVMDIFNVINVRIVTEFQGDAFIIDHLEHQDTFLMPLYSTSKFHGVFRRTCQKDGCLCIWEKLLLIAPPF